MSISREIRLSGVTGTDSTISKGPKAYIPVGRVKLDRLTGFRASGPTNPGLIILLFGCVSAFEKADQLLSSPPPAISPGNRPLRPPHPRTSPLHLLGERINILRKDHLPSLTTLRISPKLSFISSVFLCILPSRICSWPHRRTCHQSRSMPTPPTPSPHFS